MNEYGKYLFSVDPFSTAVPYICVDKALKLSVVCPQYGTAVLTGLSDVKNKKQNICSEECIRKYSHEYQVRWGVKFSGRNSQINLSAESQKNTKKRNYSCYMYRSRVLAISLGGWRIGHYSCNQYWYARTVFSQVFTSFRLHQFSPSFYYEFCIEKLAFWIFNFRRYLVEIASNYKHIYFLYFCVLHIHTCSVVSGLVSASKTWSLRAGPAEECGWTIRRSCLLNHCEFGLETWRNWPWHYYTAPAEKKSILKLIHFCIPTRSRRAVGGKNLKRQFFNTNFATKSSFPIQAKYNWWRRSWRP